MYSIIVYATIEKTYFDLSVGRFAVARPWHCGEGGTESLPDHIPLLPSKKKDISSKKVYKFSGMNELIFN